jgi:hypothetical protein
VPQLPRFLAGDARDKRESLYSILEQLPAWLVEDEVAHFAGLSVSASPCSKVLAAYWEAEEVAYGHTVFHRGTAVRSLSIRKAEQVSEEGEHQREES